MPIAQVTVSITAAGVAIQPQPINVQADHPKAWEIPDIPLGKAGTLTTRTDNDTGTVTLGAGHGFTTGDKVDVYWDGGLRYGMDATVAGNDVAVDTGAGDNLPPQDEPVVVSKQVQISAAFVGDQVELYAAMLDSLDQNAYGHAAFHAANDAEIHDVTLQRQRPDVANVQDGAINPFAATTVAYVMVSNASTTQPATFKMVVMEDSTV